MDSDSDLLKLEKEYCSYGDTVHYANHPNIFVGSKDSYLYDSVGNKFFDLQMWYSAVGLGYGNEAINNAVKDQLDTLPQLASQYLHAGKINLAAKISQANQTRFDVKGRVHFNVGGAQAVEDALKLVRKYTKSNNVFAFMGGYHGRTLGASSITSSYRYRSRFGHFGDRAMFIEFPYAFRCPQKGITDITDYYVSNFKRLFDSEYHGVYDPTNKLVEYRALFAEPVQGTGGYIIPPRNFFKELKKVLDEYGILLVIDEIQMGFYRTGKLWSIEHFDVTPDVIIFGKALTNGLNPLSGIWAKEELISPEAFPPGSTHSTFASNPIGTGAGLATLEYFDNWTTREQDIAEKGAYFLDKLKDLKDKNPQIIGNVDGLGLALHIELCEDDQWTPSRKRADYMFNEGLRGDLEYDGQKLGLVLDIGGYYKNILTLAPNLLITKDQIDLAISLLEQLLGRVHKNNI
jgi:4-aminobutyrate aminotransferase/(S)-3-amino-2-methylpropionate transaminase